jgi:hypothetical protein
MTVKPEQLKEAEDRWIRLRDARDPEADAAEREYQRLARQMTEEFQDKTYQQMISRMLH